MGFAIKRGPSTTERTTTEDWRWGVRKRKDLVAAIKTPSNEEDHLKRCGTGDKSSTNHSGGATRSSSTLDSNGLLTFGSDYAVHLLSDNKWYSEPINFPQPIPREPVSLGRAEVTDRKKRIHSSTFHSIGVTWHVPQMDYVDQYIGVQLNPRVNELRKKKTPPQSELRASGGLIFSIYITFMHISSTCIQFGLHQESISNECLEIPQCRSCEIYK